VPAVTFLLSLSAALAGPLNGPVGLSLDLAVDLEQDDLPYAGGMSMFHETFQVKSFGLGLGLGLNGGAQDLDGSAPSSWIAPRLSAMVWRDQDLGRWLDWRLEAGGGVATTTLKLTGAAALDSGRTVDDPWYGQLLVGTHLLIRGGWTVGIEINADWTDGTWMRERTAVSLGIGRRVLIEPAVEVEAKQVVVYQPEPEPEPEPEPDPVLAEMFAPGEGPWQGPGADAVSLAEQTPLAEAEDRDADGDGLDDEEEGIHRTDPHRADTDQDGLGDGDEVAQDLDPNHWDSDRDGLSDYAEVKLYRTDPLSGDSDNDAFSDKYEIETSKTSPNRRDTDQDGLEDSLDDCPDGIPGESVDDAGCALLMPFYEHGSQFTDAPLPRPKKLGRTTLQAPAQVPGVGGTDADELSGEERVRRLHELAARLGANFDPEHREPGSDPRARSFEFSDDSRPPKESPCGREVYQDCPNEQED